MLSQTAPTEHTFPLWPKKILGPAPGLKEINVVLWGLFLACLAGPLLFQVWSRLKVGPVGDFVYFYGDGRIANEFPPLRLYDYGLQVKVFDEIDPARGDLYGPSPYPPFVALFFGLIARLPYRPAYILWFAISLSLYLIGVRSILREVFPNDRIRSSLALCLALAFPPFIVNTLVSGQISSLAVCAFGLGMANERSRPFRSGLALSLLTYKPTLLLVVLPMLLLRRRMRSLSGFATGAFALLLVTTAIDGFKIWPAYLDFLNFFRRISQMSGMLKRWEFVDLTSFSSLSLQRAPAPVHLILLAALIGVTLWMGVLLWKTTGGNKPVSQLAWAAVLTWTLLLNIYVPMYDCILVVPAAVLTVGALHELRSRKAICWTILLSVSILAISWKSEAIAKTHKIQWLTILILVLGLFQLLFLHQALFPHASNASHDRLPETDESAAAAS